jgi:hypothetical protein
MKCIFAVKHDFRARYDAVTIRSLKWGCKLEVASLCVISIGTPSDNVSQPSFRHSNPHMYESDAKEWQNVQILATMQIAL